MPPTNKNDADQQMRTQIAQFHHNAMLRSHGYDDTSDTFQLPLWEDAFRAIPNDYARSALFTVTNKGAPRKSMENAPIFHVQTGTSMVYTGIELRAADDELVWQQVLNYAKNAGGVGRSFSFTLYQLCQDLDWHLNSGSYKKIDASLRRLRAGVLFVQSKRYDRVEDLPLIKSYQREKLNARKSICIVELDPRTILFFLGENYTRVLWEKYRKLSPIARRLFDYLGSHREPYPLLLESFRQMCGSDCHFPRKWKAMVKEACEDLNQSGLVKKSWVADNKILSLR